MGLLVVPPGACEIQPRVDLSPGTSDTVRIMIICENESDTHRLETLLREAGLDSESVDSMTAGCESARSERFGVIFSTPFTGDGSWMRVIGLANQHQGRPFFSEASSDVGMWACNWNWSSNESFEMDEVFSNLNYRSGAADHHGSWESRCCLRRVLR